MSHRIECHFRRSTARFLGLALVVLALAQLVSAQQVITTYSAGAPGDPFNGPQYVAFDKDGNLFVADTGNHRVQRVDKQTRAVTTVAGTGVAGYNGDGGPAVQAQLNCPKGLGFDPGGNLYIADYCQNVVRKVVPGADLVITGAADEIITSFAGNGTTDACAPPNGVAANQAPVDAPGSLAIDKGGNVFIVASDCSDFILRVDATSGLISTTNFLTGYRGSNAMVFDNGGNLYVSYFGSVAECSPASGQLLTGSESCSIAVNNVFISDLPRAFDKSGNLFVTDNQCDGGGCDLQILEITPGPDGTIGLSSAISLYAGNGLPGYSGDGGPPLDGSFRGPLGMATDAAGNLYIADSGNNVIRMVGNPPGPNAPTLTSNPPSVANQATATFTFFDGDSSVVSFACTLDGAQNACSSPVTYSSLADGSHTFSVVGKASDGTASSPTSYTWTVDTVPPPVPVIGTHPANPSGTANASFSFTDAEAGVAFTCSLDSAAIFCASPVAYTGLADGGHTFTVSAKDAAGNTSPANSFTWTIQTTTPPAPSIDSGPAALSNQTAVTFTFSDSQAGVSFICSLDAGAFGPCTSPAIYAGLPDGQHVFAVEANDPISGRSSAATTYSWTKDTTPPKVGINGDPGTVIIPAPSKVNFSSSSADTASYLCSFDGAAFTQCSPPFNQSVSNPGNHSLSVEAVDAAGNVSDPANTTWKVTYCHCPVFGEYTNPALNPVNFATTSPGGGFSIAAAASNGGARVSVVRSDGTVVYTFTVPAGYGAHWEFSPDGAHFFYFMAPPSNGLLAGTTEEIVVVDLTSGANRMLDLSLHIYNSNVQWSPSGAYLLVSSMPQYLSPETDLRLYRVAGVSSAVLVHTAQIATPGSTAGADVASWGFNQNQTGEPERAFLYAWVTGQNTYSWNVVDLATATQTITQSGTNISAYWQFNPCGNIIALVGQTSLNGEEVDLYSVETGSHIGGTSFPLQKVVLNSTSESETATITSPAQTITVARDPSCDPTTPQGTNQSVAPTAPHSNTSPATVTFSSVTQAGATGVTTSSTGNPPPPNFSIGTPPVYYDVLTSASYSGPITICINYSGIAFGGGAPKLFHYENGAWVDRTTSVDAVNHIVCGTVSSLSPFALFGGPTQAPTIDSGASAVMQAGSAGSFTTTASGDPTPSWLIDGILPDGVTFVDNGNGTATLSGTPTTTGVYPLTLAAFNGVGPDAVQSFTLTVGSLPAFTSGNAATFTAGMPGSFTVAATGFPAPSLSETGALPAGVSFDPHTGMLSGTPATGTGGVYHVVFSATNAAGSAGQSFTLTVLQAPAITSANTTTFTLSAASSFLVQSSGFPVAALSVKGALPAGVGFVDNGNGTGTLSGVPTAAGSFSVNIAAANGVGAGATQTFTLQVSGGPIASVSPGSVNFGGVRLYNFATAKLTITNVGTSPLTISRMYLTLGAGADRDDFFWASFCPASLDPGRACPVYVIYFADELGTASATLNIVDNSAAGLETIGLAGTGTKK